MDDYEIALTAALYTGILVVIISMITGIVMTVKSITTKK